MVADVFLLHVKWFSDFGTKISVIIAAKLHVLQCKNVRIRSPAQGPSKKISRLNCKLSGPGVPLALAKKGRFRHFCNTCSHETRFPNFVPPLSYIFTTLLDAAGARSYIFTTLFGTRPAWHLPAARGRALERPGSPSPPCLSHHCCTLCPPVLG